MTLVAGTRGKHQVDVGERLLTDLSPAVVPAVHVDDVLFAEVDNLVPVGVVAG
jgi:hypothetical protein